MSRMPSEDRRTQIMDAALPLFAQKGFKGTTNRDIAEAAGIAPGLIYWYFKSKEDLFSSILDAHLPMNTMTVPLEQLRELPPTQVMPLLAQGIAAIFNESRIFDIGRIIIAESLHNAAEGKRLHFFFRRVIDPLADYLQYHITLGNLRQEDPLLMAQMFMSSCILFFIRRRIEMDETLLHYDIPVAMQFTVSTFLRAFAIEHGSE